MPDATPAPPRVLVVGGTGAFGGRLVIGLLETTELDVIAAGRNEVWRRVAATWRPP